MLDFLGTPFLLEDNYFRGLTQLTSEMLEAQRGQRLEKTWTVQQRGTVAVMQIHGPIARHDSFLLWLRGGTALEDLSVDFNTALQNPGIKSIVLHIGSPGGEAAGINEFAEMIHNSSKPVFAYVGDVAASGALWIASSAKEIIVDPTAELGSLGVVFGYRKDESKVIEIVSTVSPKKRLDPATEEGRAEVQQRADDLAEIFVSQVAKYRKMTTEKVKADFGQGGMMIAAKAIKAGMADRIGSFEGLISSLQQTSTTIYGGPRMGLITELRALIAGKADADIDAAFAAVGYQPKTKETAAPDLEQIKAEAMAAGKTAGETAAQTAEKASVTAIMEKCQLAQVTSPKFIAEVLGLTPEDAGKKIIEAQADEAARREIFSTVNPLTTGERNPVADAFEAIAKRGA